MPAKPDIELDALQTVISALSEVEEDSRKKILDTASTFFGLLNESPSPITDIGASEPVATRTSSYPAFSESRELSPKEFIFQKQPKTDVERIAVLAYYLTHYRETPHFKTLDLSKLNTEAANPKFSNAATSANNAVKQGYLVPATKGQRQLSAAGERFVAALPDRDAAREAMSGLKPRRKQKKTPKPASP